MAPGADTATGQVKYIPLHRSTFLSIYSGYIYLNISGELQIQFLVQVILACHCTLRE